MSVMELKNSEVRRPRRVFYPDGDGKPMAETNEHRDAMAYAINAGQVIFADRSDVWVSGNDFVYYVEGDASKRVSPDCYVVLGVPAKRQRRSFKVWEENGRTPNLVVEFTSRKTARQDREEKFDLYQNVLRVPEYILFDPTNQYLRPRLQGYRLNNGVYRPLVPDSEGRLVSLETGIVFFPEGELLRLIHPVTGQIMPTYSESTQLRVQAEDELTKLRAELDALRRERGE